MDTLTYQVRKLQREIGANREKHQAAFTEAMSGFQEQAERALYKRAEQIRAEKTTDLTFQLPTPQNHTADYDAVLAMLAMTTDTEIILDQRDFRRYMLDEWDWSANFLRVCSGYSGAVSG